MKTTRFKNVLTGATIRADYQPAGDAWVPASTSARSSKDIARRLLQEEKTQTRAPRKSTKKETTHA